MINTVKSLLTGEKKLESDDYIRSESQEINLGETEGWAQKLFYAFPALRHRNFQLYFYGQLISLVGTWMQLVSQGWLALQLTHSAFFVGLITALHTLPTLLFSLVAGVIVDRFPKKKILFLTQFSSLFFASLLGILTIFDMITIWYLAILVFLLGCVEAIDRPARQAFVVEMVGKEDLVSAIALNAGVFNSARVIGPAVAGILIGLYGTGGAFLINGLSYIAVIVSLSFIHPVSMLPRVHLHPLLALKEGISYVATHKVIRQLVLLCAVSSVFAWSYVTLMPVIVKEVYHLDAFGLGYFYGASSIGALVGAAVVSMMSKRTNPWTLILGGNFIFCCSIILFSLQSSFWLALLFLFFAGFGILTQHATMNSQVQHMVKDTVRGRVMSIYTLAFVGLSPLGSIQIGFLAEHLGAPLAIRIGASMMLFFGVYLLFNYKKLTAVYETYQ